MSNLVGTPLGGYILTRFLGSGGMGTVYLAEDRAIGQQVAIKVVRADEADDSDLAITPQQTAERFRQEARAVASLDHLHILPLYRYGEEVLSDGRRAYIIMQYRPEGSLWDWLRRRAGMATAASLAAAPSMPVGLPHSWPLSVEEAGEYVGQAASALQYAHNHGIVHRDVKPANFLLRFDTSKRDQDSKAVFLLLSDFGLAKFFTSTSSTSTVFGTPLYMAPEQFDGAARPESDQYALAVMTYYLLAGRPPFEGDPMRLMNQHLNTTPPPIRAFAPGLSPGVEQVLARALAKKPEQRYPAIADFADAFTQRMYEAVRNIAPPFSLPSVGRSTQFTVQSAPTVQAQPLNIPTTTQAVPTDSAFTPTKYAGPPALLQHGGQSRPTSTQQGGQALLALQPPLTQTKQPAPTNQRHASRRKMLAWLIGGVIVAGVGVGVGLDLYLKPESTPTPVPTSTQVRHVFKGHTETVTSVIWSPDGTQLASSSGDHTVRLWSVNNQQQTLAYSEHTLGVLSAAWKADGTSIASGGRDKTVQIWSTAGMLQHRFADQGAIVSSLVWNSRGELFAATLGNGVSLLSPSGTSHKLIKGSFHALSLSPGGRYLALGNERGIITMLDLTGVEQPRYHIVHIGPILAVAWSPSGLLLATGGADKTANVLDARTAHIIHSMKHTGAVNGIAWHPNGKGGIATASEDTKVHVWAAAGQSPTLYEGHSGPVTSVAWSSAGLISGSQDTTIILWNI